MADHVALGEGGQSDRQAVVDGAADPVGPAAGFGEPAGDVQGPGQPGVVRAGVPGGAGSGEVAADLKQCELLSAADWPGHRLGAAGWWTGWGGHRPGRIADHPGLAAPPGKGHGSEFTCPLHGQWQRGFRGDDERPGHTATGRAGHSGRGAGERFRPGRSAFLVIASERRPRRDGIPLAGQVRR